MEPTESTTPDGDSMTARLETAPSRARERAPDLIHKAIGYLVPFTLVLYLGLESGGYEIGARGQVGILVWWFLLVFTLVGFLPSAKITARSWIAIGLLAGFGIWTFVGLAWTESAERTFVEGARVITLLGVLVLSIFLQGRDNFGQTAGGVGAAIVVVASVGLLSRLQPDLFPEIPSLDLILGAEYRLSFPLGYWNGLAALTAIGVPLVFRAAASAATPLIRGLASISFVLLVLTLYYTFSRAGILAALIATGVLFALTPRRLELLVKALVPLIGAGLLVVMADSRPVLGFGRPGPEYTAEANEMTVLLILVIVAVGLIQAGLAIAERRGIEVEIAPARRVTVGIVVAAGVLLTIAGLALDGPGRASDAWESFREVNTELKGSERVFDPSGNGRIELWSSAIDAWESSPFVGIGAGTFEYWWNQNGPIPLVVRDAHSLYLEVLGEQGLIGLLIILSLLGLTVGTGITSSLNGTAPRTRREIMAAATAALVGFTVTTALDWNWELTVTPVAALFLGGAILGRYALENQPINQAGQNGPSWSLGPKLGVGLASLLAIVVLAVDVTGNDLLKRSQEQFREGRVSEALASARDAGRVLPWAASPDLQQAYALSEIGENDRAVEAAVEATRKDPVNWRAWLVLAKVAGRAERPGLAIEALDQAQKLNPKSSLWLEG
jgi:hypothetical protein